jgi:protein gp37
MNEQRAPHGIEWTRINRDGTKLPGFTWNPVAGCQHGCEWRMPNGEIAVCYAETVAERLATRAYPHGFAHHYWHPDRLSEPLAIKRPSGIFLDSMSDLMGPWVPDEQIQQVLDVCRAAHWHTFQLLTKNAPRLLQFKFPRNVWVGASSPPDFMHGKPLNRQQQEAMLEKIFDTLPRINVPVRWISFEPLSWDVSSIVKGSAGAIQWAVIGAASDGRKYFAPAEHDLRQLLDVLDALRVPVFFKGNMHSSEFASEHWREEFPAA